MGQVRHGSATTTHAIRAAMFQSVVNADLFVFPCAGAWRNCEADDGAALPCVCSMLRNKRLRFASGNS
jgi:hypothetical protein